ncbi:hypothetical protein ABES25_15360 [Bacillus gobiensis]
MPPGKQVAGGIIIGKETAVSYLSNLFPSAFRIVKRSKHSNLQARADS